MALFWLRMSYHAQRYMFQRYMLRSLLTQSFNIVNTPIILLFSKKWVPGFAAEDNTIGGIIWEVEGRGSGSKSSTSDNNHNQHCMHPAITCPFLGLFFHLFAHSLHKIQ